jgi:hypothetical protein
MRYILAALISVCAFFAQAQQINPVPDYVFGNRMSVGRTSVTDTAAYFSVGPRYGAIRGMMPPMVVDTASVSGNKRNGLLIFSVQKNKFLYWDSVRVQWSDMAGSSGSYIVAGDTASMLLPYLRKADTTAMLAPYLKESDTVFLSNRVNLKVNIADTATMLAPYLKESDTVFLSNRVNLKVNISDTSSMLNNYVRHAGYGLTKSGQAFLVDTAAMATRARVQKGIDSVATLAVGGVTSVATGYGLSGGTITSTGTISADTALIASRLRVGKVVDSLSSVKQNVLTNPVTGTGTTNYVAKFTGTSAVGNSQIFDNGTRVGIGIASPGFKLHAVGTSEGYLVSEATNKGGGAGIIAFSRNTDSTRQAGAVYFVPSTTTPYISLSGDGSQVHLAVTGAGDVGIGNVAPAYKLDVTGTLRNTTGAAFATSSGNVLIGTTTDAGYKTDIAGTLRSTLGANFATTSGNVGIGTASPSQKLDVAGITRVNGGTIYAQASGTESSGYQLNAITLGYDAINAVGWITAGGAAARTNLVLQEGSGGELLIGTKTDAGDYKLQVAGSIYNTTGAVLAASSGNVGVGLVPSTTNLGRALEIINPGVQLFSYATDNIYLNANSYYSSAWKYGSTAAASQYLQFSGRHIWNQAASGTAGTNITFTTPMEINVGGELLVGSGASDAGDYKLQVNGNERIAGKLDVITTTEYGVNLGRSGTSATAFQAYNSTAAMAVGIESSAGGGLFTGTSAYAAVFGNANNYPTQFVTNNTLRATISAAGELLVGTTSDQGDYNIQTNNAIYAAGNAAGVGVLVGSDKSIETTGVNLNINANQGGAGTSTISMKLTSATPAFTFTSDAVMLFGTNTYSTMTNGLTMKNGTAPTGSATDQFHMYSADITAGNAAAHFRTENNAVIKLYQETTGVAAAAFTANSGTAVNDASTFDGYTLKQVVKALRNLGILQ